MRALLDNFDPPGHFALAAVNGAIGVANDALLYLGSTTFATDLASLVGVLVLDHAWRGPGRSSLSRLVKLGRSVRADLLCFALTNTLLMGALITLLSFQLGGWARAWLGEHVAFTLVGSVTSPPLQTLVFLVLFDFLSYWRHRFSHEWKWWWELHKYHHAATDLTVLTSYRLHPADMAMNELFLALPMALVGMPLRQYALVRSLVFAQGLLNHSLLDWKLGPLGRLLVSPWAHRIHHSTLPEHVNRNYGGMFSLWDQLFGSWYRGERLNTETEIGVPGNDYNRRNLLVEFLLPVWRSARVIARQLNGEKRKISAAHPRSI